MRKIRATISTILPSLLFATFLITSGYSGVQQQLLISSSGTINYQINYQDDFTNSIIFEYGAESGKITDYFTDSRVPDRMARGQIQVVSDNVISGTKSVMLYQKAPPKQDDERRSDLDIMGSRLQLTEAYFSWKMDIDEDLFLESNPDWGPTVGGFQMWFGPDSNPYLWRYGGRFITGSSKQIQFSYGFWKFPDSSVQPQTVSTGKTWYDYAGKVVRFMVYFKIRPTGGAVKAWINDELVCDIDGIITDPRAFSEWDSNGCRFADGGPYPKCVVQIYQGETSYENRAWVDDMVVATQKIPVAYSV